jgi:1-acyl-sn-glycerol-3-phosphate acyltransferase
MIDPVKHEVMADMRTYQISTSLFKLGFKLYNRFSSSGGEYIPTEGGVLIASNHASYLDPPVVGVGYRGRPIHFMARDTLWKPGFGAWWMDRVGCIPVARGTGDIRALKLTIKALREGKVVSIFPEGTRSVDGELGEAKSGIGMIVEKAKCAVVPAYIFGTYAAYPKGATWIKPLPIRIVYGKPIQPAEFQALGSGRDAYQAYADLIMQRIQLLKETG